MDMTDLKDRLETWERQGLLSHDQADRILDFEGREPTRRFPPWMEAVAYLGAALVLLALILLASEFWDRLTGVAQFALALVVTGILVTTGFLLRESQEPAAARAGSFAWLLAIGGAGFAAWVAGDRMLDLVEERSALLAALAAFGTALALWWMARRTAQMIGMGLAAAFAAFTVMAQFDPMPDWGPNAALATVGAVWLLLTWGGIFEPEKVSYALGSIGVLFIGFFELLGTMPWPLLGLLAALSLMALAVRLEQGIMLGIGVAGLFLYVPATVFEVWGDTVGVPIALLITGIVLLAGILVAVRLRKEV